MSEWTAFQSQIRVSSPFFDHTQKDERAARTINWDSIKEGTFTHRILKVGEHFVQGEVALQKEDWETAIWHLKKAIAVEDTLRYTEPPYWLQPVRHTLGAVYMKTGQHQLAAQVYQEDLRIWKDNGWSLFGLSQALKAMEKLDESKSILTKLDEVWKNADEPHPETSCKCIKDLKSSTLKQD